jgi:putative addiction module killer protein
VLSICRLEEIAAEKLRALLQSAALHRCSVCATILGMLTVRETEVFTNWLRDLRDREAKARVEARIQRLSLGNPGDVRPVGQGVSEMRIDYGPGYRVYFIQQGQTLVVLLAGGDKRTQDKDIQTALELAREL